MRPTSSYTHTVGSFLIGFCLTGYISNSISIPDHHNLSAGLIPIGNSQLRGVLWVLLDLDRELVEKIEEN